MLPLALLLLFATDYLGRGTERHADGLAPEPTLAVGWGVGRGRFRLIVGKPVLLRRCARRPWLLEGAGATSQHVLTASTVTHTVYIRLRTV